MQRERWERVKEIAGACLELDPATWESHIRGACEGDQALFSEVNSLLSSYAGMGDFLAVSVIEDEGEALPAGSRVGLYEIREPLAEGGMGTVYRAVRTSDFEKQVAVKVVKRGMDTKFVLQRFRHERQILAALEHPNIARLLDGGATDDGRPYLVMEYIAGRPITAYVEEERLTISDRLQLFRTVCSAVQYAHQNLVVHRDLKPSNILVTAAGVPKLLDFGIAKLLESDVDVTRASMRLMTPECASPEQVRGEPITTATDIYSLGVLLYELLAGARPYRFTTRSAAEIQRLVCETDPKRPSAVRRLSEDLDHIVFKAMHKDPSRRYVSAEQLSEDVSRYLQGLPISARKDSTWYRARKFVGRHKAASLAGAALSLSLMGGMGATLWEAHVARSESALAERRLNDVRALANSLIFDVHDAISTLPGATAARKLVVDRALTYLDRVALDAADDDSLRRQLATGYWRLGEVQGDPGSSNLGNSAAAVQSLRKAVRLFEALRAKGRQTLADEQKLAVVYDSLGRALFDTGDRSGADACDRKALALRLAMAGRLPLLESVKGLANSYHSIGMHRAMTGDFAGALESHQKFLEAEEQIARAEPNFDRRSLSLAHKRVGAVLIMLHRLSEALAHYRTAEAIDEQRVAAAPENAEARMDLTFAASDIGHILRTQGHWSAALAEYRKVEAVRASLVSLDPKDVRARRGLASTRERIAEILQHLGDRKQSLFYYRKALAATESLFAEDSTNFERQLAVAENRVSVGDAYASLAADATTAAAGRVLLWGEARSHYSRARQLIAELKTRNTVDNRVSELDRQAIQQLVRCDAAIAQLSVARTDTPLSANVTR